MPPTFSSDTSTDSKYSRRHRAVTRADEQVALITTQGNRLTGDAHLQSNEQLEDQSYAYSHSDVYADKSTLLYRPDNMAYNVAVVFIAAGLGILLFNR